MKNIVIFGAGGHAKVIADIIERQREFKIVGFLDDFKLPGSHFYGYPILGNIDYLSQEMENLYGGVVAIGDNSTRSKLVNKIKIHFPEFRFISAVHPDASIARGVFIGEGTVVMANASINSDAFIGEHCIINTKASIGHDCIIGNFATAAPNTTLGGGVTVGEGSTLSISSTVIHGIEIGIHTVVGAGATVVKNVPPYSIAYGVPAERVRGRAAEESYL